MTPTPLKSLGDLPTVPGMYMAVTNPGDVFARLFVLEVDEEGAIHQLVPDGADHRPGEYPALHDLRHRPHQRQVGGLS